MVRYINWSEKELISFCINYSESNFQKRHLPPHVGDYVDAETSRELILGQTGCVRKQIDLFYKQLAQCYTSWRGFSPQPSKWRQPSVSWIYIATRPRVSDVINGPLNKLCCSRFPYPCLSSKQKKSVNKM